MPLFCAAIRRNFVSLLRFPFLSLVLVFSCEVLLICRLKCPSTIIINIILQLFSHFPPESVVLLFVLMLTMLLLVFL